MILECFPSGPLRTNAYLLGCSETKKAVVIDVPFESADLLIHRSLELGLQIEAILLTHSHLDHIGEAKLLKERLGIPIYIHREDAGNLANPGSDGLPLYLPVPGVISDGFVEEGQVIRVGNLEIEVIHTPGHSPGCVCFYLPKEKILISGDTLFRGTIGNLGFPSSRPGLMSRSLKKLAALPKETRVYPGHGAPTTIQAEHWIAHAKIKE